MVKCIILSSDSVFDDTVQLRTVITLYVNAKFDLGQKNLPGRIYPMFSDDDMKQLAVDVSGVSTVHGLLLYNLASCIELPFL